MSDVNIALVSAGAALFGALLGGGMQLVLHWFQQRGLRMRGRAERRRALYGEFVVLVIGIPDVIVEASIEGLVYETRKSLAHQYTNLRAQLLLDASPTVQAGVAQVWTAVNHAFGRWEHASTRNIEKPADERVGADQLLRDAFRDLVDPKLEALAATMATEIV